ncbi:MAG: FecR family protein [Burkholderiales bacterium]
MRNQRWWKFASAIFASAIAGALWAGGAFAAAMVADLEGDVRVEVTGAKSRALVPGERVASGSLVTTAPGARLKLRFDDGQWAALHENTQFRIEDFHYGPQEPKADRAAFVLLRGALRIVTGALGRRNPEAFELRAPNLLIGVRGTDFMVAIADSTYLSVLEGAVTATNAGGTATFRAGDLGATAAEATLAAAIQANALPAAVTTPFGSLGALRVAPPASPGAAGKAEPAKDARTRELKDDLGNHGKDAPGAARERGRDLKPRPK